MKFYPWDEISHPGTKPLVQINNWAKITQWMKHVHSKECYVDVWRQLCRGGSGLNFLGLCQVRTSHFGLVLFWG
jgi:hypothetical protein